MAVDLKTLPHPDHLPIPENVSPNRYWSPFMVELSDFVGPRAALLICDHFGGQKVDIPADPALNPFRHVIGDEKAAVISKTFRRERIEVPRAGAALRYARRQGVLARVRAGEINLSKATLILRSSRRYVTELINGTTEGMGKRAN